MTEEEKRWIETAPFTLTDRTGRCVLLVDATDKMLKSKMMSNIRKIRRMMFNVASIKSEMERREYAGSLENFTLSKNFNIFQMMTHQSLIAVNRFNTHYPERAFNIVKEEEGEEE
jgi:K+-transporting ATPase A subunit